VKAVVSAKYVKAKSASMWAGVIAALNRSHSDQAKILAPLRIDGAGNSSIGDFVFLGAIFVFNYLYII
jgi:hypothetical protein